MAWEFTETEICRLSHTEDHATVDITFDPRIALYSITMRQTAVAWPDAPSFQIRFDGPQPFTIATTDHLLSDDGKGLKVQNTGFGNVLDGIALNTTMTALTGGTAVSLSTQTATDPMQAFRACPTPATS